MTGKLSRRRFLRLAAAGGGTAIVGLGAEGAVAGPWFPRLEEVSVPVAGLPPAFTGFRILHLSDFHHSNTVPLSLITRAISLAAGLAPDLVALTGDFVTTERLQPGAGASYAEACAGALGLLSAPCGVAAVLGNHDYDSDPGRVTHALEGAGIRVLSDENVLLERGGERIRLAGLADFWRAPDREDSIRRALAGRGEGETVIALAHNPDQFPELAAAGVALTLSGHTHGGQVRIPGWGPLWVPSRYGARYAQGLIEENGARLYVTRGIGTLFMPVRLACPAEVTLLTLVPAVPR